MEDFHAYRNIKLCSKDCLCLFVCPTGATNNETGQIDFSKCIGCGACAVSCPSRAITMIPNTMPDPQVKSKKVIDKLFEIANNKISEIEILKHILENSKNEDVRLIEALIYSNKIVIEDLMREADFMLPQGKKSLLLLSRLSKNEETKDIASKLLNSFK